MKSIQQKFDFFFHKVIPKKLLVWIMATIFVFLGKLDGELWAYISMVYIGGNLLQKFILKDKVIKINE